jgi:hypothetical protein
MDSFIFLTVTPCSLYIYLRWCFERKY